MPRPRVVVTNRVHESVLSLLRARCEVAANNAEAPWAPEEVRTQCAAAEGLLAFMTDRVDEAFLEACPRLGIIACALKGLDNFDLAACTRRGVVVTYCEDLLTAPTAELAVGLMIALARNLLAGDRRIRAGAFQGWRPWLYGTSLEGAVVGLVGMGAVGRAIAARLAGFGCRLIYSDPRPPTAELEAGLRLERRSFADLLDQADFLVTTAPLTSETLHMIDAAALAAMKPGAFLVNPGRGSLVDEAAVARALEDGRLGGYAADVFETEDRARPDRPRDVHPGLRAQSERSLLTPHLGSAVRAVRERIELTAAQAILDHLDGRRPAGVANPAALAPAR
jgi:phosphonate dehydrogenase